VFFDEIGDLPLAIQVKLLRVLEEGVFTRLGSAKPIKSNFRIIAATNKNLGEEVKKGNFRQDLFYRLNVFPIYIPPLRERKEDIIPLAFYFLKSLAKSMAKNPKHFQFRIEQIIKLSLAGKCKRIEARHRKSCYFIQRFNYKLCI